MVLPPEDAAAVERNTDIAERIARLWESTLGLESMRSNERGDFVEAAAMLRDEGDMLVAFSAGTHVEKSIGTKSQYCRTEGRPALGWSLKTRVDDRCEEVFKGRTGSSVWPQG